MKIGDDEYEPDFLGVQMQLTMESVERRMAFHHCYDGNHACLELSTGKFYYMPIPKEPLWLVAGEYVSHCPICGQAANHV